MRRSLLNKRILPKPLRQALVLITLLLLPSTAWGQAEDTADFEWVVQGTSTKIENGGEYPVNALNTQGYSCPLYVKEGSLVSSPDRSVTYASSNEDVATIDNTGVVTIKAIGSTTITATLSNTDTYTYPNGSKTCSYTLKVSFPAPGFSCFSGDGGTYKINIYFEETPQTSTTIKYKWDNNSEKSFDAAIPFQAGTLTAWGVVTNSNSEEIKGSEATITYYGLIIGGTPLSNDNVGANGAVSNISNIINGSVSFTPANTNNTPATLSLVNANIQSWASSAIEWLENGPLYVQFSGTNSIKMDLNADASGDNEGFSIQGNGNSSSTLTLIGADNSSLTLRPSNSYKKAISGFTDVQIDNTNGWGMYYTDDYSEVDPPQNPTASKEVVLLKNYLGIAVAGVPVTSSNASEITGDGISGTISFDPEEKILTLDNATIDYSETAGNPIVSSIDNLKVKLIGVNEIKIFSAVYFGFKYTDDATSGALTFVDPTSFSEIGQLSVSSEEISSISFDNFSSGYTITGFTDFADGGSNEYYNPDNSGWVKYQTTSYVKVRYIEVYDLWVEGSRISSINLNPWGSGYTGYNPETHSIAFDNNSSILRINSNLPELIIELSGDNSLTVTDTDTSEPAISFTSSDKTPTGKLKFTVGGNSATVNSMVIDCEKGAIVGFSEVIVDDPLKISVNSTTKVVISDEEFYNLWVGGVQVSSGNASDIFNTTETKNYATASFDKTTNTLTLKEANIQVNGKNGIESGLATLTVIISGTNSIDCQGTETVAFKGVGTDNAIAFKLDTSDPGELYIQCSNNPIIDGLEVEYEDGIGLIALESDYYSIGELQKPEINSSASDEGISVALILPSGDSYIGSTMYYSITYNDEEVENTPYSTAFTMSKPGIVTAYLVPSLGGRSGNSVGKYYGYPDAPYTMAVGDELTPEIYPAIEENDYIGLNGSASADESIATFTYTDGVVKALAAGTVTLTAILTGSDMSFTVLNPKESSEQSNYNYPVTFSVVVGENLNTIFAANQNFGTWYNTSDKTYKVPDGITAYIITGVDGDKVTIAETKVIPPNAPILMEKGENAKAFTYTEATDTDGSFPSGNILNYTTTDKEAVEASKLYVLYNGQFVKVTAGTKILANHCYLDLGGTSAGTRGFYNIGDGEGTTAIREVIYEGVNSEKWNGEWFDLQGRRLYTKPNKSGLYILNGRKVVIK